MTREQEYTEIQNSLRDRLRLCDSFDMATVTAVAGVDLAYWTKDDREYAVCCIAVIDFKTHEVIERAHSNGEITTPYMPGFLAFRELPLVIETAKLLTSDPDIYMFDGNGYLHPRHMGIASHASFYLNKPTVGVAKTYFRADRKTDFIMPDTEAGSCTDIVIDGEVYGRALRTHTNVRPVFVSAGNYISLETATEITMQLVDRESRIPIPTRIADLDTHIKRSELLSG